MLKKALFIVLIPPTANLDRNVQTLEILDNFLQRVAKIFTVLRSNLKLLIEFNNNSNQKIGSILFIC